MKNFVIIVDWGDLFPAEYAYQAETFEDLCKSPNVMQEMSRYSVTEDKWKVYCLSDEKFKQYLVEAKKRVKKQKAYRRELERIRVKMGKKGYAILLVDDDTVYGTKSTAIEHRNSLKNRT